MPVLFSLKIIYLHLPHSKRPRGLHLPGAPGYADAPRLCRTPPRGAALRQGLFCLLHSSPSLEAAMNPNPRFPNPAFINDLVGKLGEVLKQSPARDIEQNLRAGVTSMLAKLDMVSREEFDVQAEVLARTREKLTQLEARLAELEKRQREEE
jgi:BMFP domain-containing protein YqiC